MCQRREWHPLYEVGQALKEARERQRLTLRQAEETTNIRLEYLKCLEEGELDRLPGRVYAVGFLRSYAKLLNLNPEPLVAELKSCWQDDSLEIERELQVEDNPKARKRSSLPVARFVGYAVAVGLALLLIYVAFSIPGVQRGSDTSAKPTPSTTPGTVEPGPSAINKPAEVSNSIGQSANSNPAAGQTSNPGNNASAEPAYNGVIARIAVTTGSSWIAVYIDGRKDFEGILVPGDKREFKGLERVFLHVGNAGVLQVNVNGKDFGILGQVGEVVRKEFTKTSS